jgi:hypothetical protein
VAVPRQAPGRDSSGCARPKCQTTTRGGPDGEADRRVVRGHWQGRTGLQRFCSNLSGWRVNAAGVGSDAGLLEAGEKGLAGGIGASQGQLLRRGRRLSWGREPLGRDRHPAHGDPRHRAQLRTPRPVQGLPPRRPRAHSQGLLLGLGADRAEAQSPACSCRKPAMADICRVGDDQKSGVGVPGSGPTMLEPSWPMIRARGRGVHRRVPSCRRPLVARSAPSHPHGFSASSLMVEH